MAREHENPSPPPPGADRRQAKSQLYDRHRSLSTSYASAFSDTSRTNADDFNLLPPSTTADLVSLVAELDSDDPRLQLSAVSDLRLLAKHSPDNRVRIAKAGAVLPLVSLLSSADPLIQEQSATTILNLCLHDPNRPLLAAAGAIPALTAPLRDGNPSARANAAAALLRLAQHPALCSSVAKSGAVPLLVDLLQSPDRRGQKDAATALYALCSGEPEARLRAIRAGIVRPLLELIAAADQGISDKAAYLLAVVAPAKEAREDLVAEGGIPVLVETIEEGSARMREAAADVLLRVCQESAACRAMASREGAIPAATALLLSGTDRAKKKAEALLEVLKPFRAGTARLLDVPVEQCY